MKLPPAANCDDRQLKHVELSEDLLERWVIYASHQKASNASLPFTGLIGFHTLVIDVRWSLLTTGADRVRDIFLTAGGYLISFHVVTCIKSSKADPIMICCMIC